MRINNLPPFGEKAPFPPPSKAGEWVKAPGSLKKLGQSLKVDDKRPDSSQATIIRAIPDPWAQARTFAEAVLDEEHSMHGSAIAQWRGLLALFALADLRKADYSLDVQGLTLGDDHPFDRVLKHLPPQISLGDNAGLWLTPYIVYVKPKRGKTLPIAMLNPASLVSPGRTSWQVPFDFIPWMRAGLSDPLTLKGENALANTQLAALAAYLAAVRDAVPREGNANAGVLRQHVQDFLDEIDALRGESPMSATVRRTSDTAVPELYRSLISPAELKESKTPWADSECKLVLANAEALKPLEGVILVDESVGTTLKRAPRDIIVWGNRTLSELLGSPHELQVVREQAADAGWLVITADDLLTPRLVRLAKDPRIAGHGPDMRDMLEPIRPLSLLLDQTGVHDFQVDRGDSRTTVTLHMLLAGRSARLQHAVSRTYRADEASPYRLVGDVDWDFGQTSIWPDFKSSQWPYYFARLTYPTTREQIRPQFALSREIIAAAIAAYKPAARDGATDDDPGNDGAASGSTNDGRARAIQELQAINAGKAPSEKPPVDQEAGKKVDWFHRSQSVAGKAYEELQISDRPFEAVFYVDYSPERGDAQVGCVRLKLAEPKKTENRAQVAIDFGSTNSIACITGSSGKAVTFKGRIVHPIMFQDAARNDEWRHIVRWNYVEFLPLADRDTPTPTVVISRVDPDRNADLWLNRNLIYFQPAGTHARDGAEKEIERLESYLKRSEFDLKWNEDPEHIDASADFLEQFMTMVAAEAAAAEYNPRLIEWNFSVPDAMQGTRLTSFRTQVEVAREKLSPAGKLNDLYSEGLAAARFILAGKEGAKFTPGTINAILDIGGSTTDITLWANEVLVWKGSFRLAGRAFFTETIVQNPKILREIELSDWADLIDPGKASRVRQDIAADVGELLFSRPALSEAFDKHWNRRLNVKTGEVLRTTALAYLSGIAYYLGLVARQLVEDKVLKEADLVRPAFALCGRGAGIFDRMHAKLGADQESQVTNALQTFSKAAEIESMPRPQIFLSKQPKLEVAAGMMVKFDTINAKAGNGKPKSTFTPAGLALDLVDGTQLESGTAIGTALSAGSTSGSDLATLTAFLEAFDEFTGIRIDLRQGAGQGAFNEINTVVRQKVDRQKNDVGELVLTEPPFITALGALVAIMASPEDERDARLGVEVTG